MQKIEPQIDTTVSVDPDQIKSIGPRGSKAWQTEPEIVRRWTRPPSAGCQLTNGMAALMGMRQVDGRHVKRAVETTSCRVNGRSVAKCTDGGEPIRASQGG